MQDTADAHFAPVRPRGPHTTPVAPGRWVIAAQGIALAILAMGFAPLLRRLLLLVIVATVTAIAAGAGKSRHAGTASAGFGLIGVACALGVGVAHAVRTGPGVDAIAGLVTLATGLWLTGIGTARLVRRRRGLRRLEAAPVALLAAVLVVYPLTLALLVTRSPHVPIGDETPRDAGLIFESVEIVTADGVALAGWHIPTGNGAAVVLLHGGGPGSNRTSVLDEAAVLAGAGYGILMLDARGHGESEGVGMELGWFGERDVSAALDYLGSEPGVTGPIAAVGLSMGGEQAITAAAADERIRAVVAEGATNRVLADDDIVLPDTPLRWINLAADAIKYTLTDWLTPARPPVALVDAVAATAPRPVLLITAALRPVERDAAAELAAAAPGAVETWDVPGASHAAGLAAAPEAWAERVVGFLDRHLRGR